MQCTPILSTTVADRTLRLNHNIKSNLKFIGFSMGHSPGNARDQQWRLHESIATHTRSMATRRYCRSLPLAGCQSTKYANQCNFLAHAWTADARCCNGTIPVLGGYVCCVNAVYKKPAWDVAKLCTGRILMTAWVPYTPLASLKIYLSVLHQSRTKQDPTASCWPRLASWTSFGLNQVPFWQRERYSTLFWSYRLHYFTS